ncbi:MAG TPA: hypothetical protein VJP85_07785 [Candidatus Baltobacteraceae bacterium]|nr:hypothetical protein [Candidatus Baltobacteraceae bacterium]
MKRLFLSVAGAALAIGLVQTAQGLASAQPAPGASAAASPTPTASPTSTFTLPTPKTSATPAPPKDTDEKRVGISGVWEVQIQQSSTTMYTHFKLDEKGNALTGQYLDTSGKKYRLAGSVNGKDVHLVVNMPDGTALVFDGSVEGSMDMAGTITTSKDVVGFTAAYRPKYKWIDNLSPNPGLPGTP